MSFGHSANYEVKNGIVGSGFGLKEYRNYYMLNTYMHNELKPKLL